MSKLALNVPGGFTVGGDKKKVRFEEECKIVLLPDYQEFVLDDPDVPLAIQLSAKTIIKTDSALKKSRLEEVSGVDVR